MFNIQPRYQGVTQELMDLYRDISSSTIGHLTDFGFIKGLQPLFRPIRFIGNAVTVKIPHLDSIAVHKALEFIEPGDVMVIDMSGDIERSCWGGIVSYAASVKKLSGVVINGCVNDFNDIKSLQLPIYCMGTSSLTTRILGLEGEVNTAISIRGVSVKPGDLILADDDGVVAIDPKLAVKYGEIAIQKESREDAVKQKLDAGLSLASISKARHYFSH